MHYSLIVPILLIAICTQGFAASIKQTWRYLKYDGTTTSAVLNIERVGRSRVKYVLQVSDFSESIEVFPVTYGVLSRLKSRSKKLGFMDKGLIWSSGAA
jgi:hypothetical protein